METHIQRRRRQREHGGDDVLRAFDARGVDDHVRRAELLQKTQRLVARVLFEPRRMAELDQHLVITQLLACPAQVVERRILAHDVRGQLEENAAQLPCRAQRLERTEETLEHLTAKLARRPVDTTFVVRRRVVPEVGRQLLELDRMTGHESEGLDVHDEAVGRALGPTLDHLLRRQAVVRGIHLDRVELLRVVPEPFAGRQARRIEVLRERLVRPRAGSDPKLRHDASIKRRGRSRPRLFEAALLRRGS